MLSLLVLCLAAQPPTAVAPQVRAKLEKVIKDQQLGAPLSEHAVALPQHQGAARYLVPVRNTWLRPPVLNLYVVGKGSPKPIPDLLGKGDAALVFVAVQSVELRSEAGEDRVVVTAEYHDKKKAKVLRSATYKVGDKLQRLEEGAASQVTVLDTSCRSQPLPFKGSGKLCPAADGAVQLSLTGQDGKVHALTLKNDGIEVSFAKVMGPGGGIFARVMGPSVRQGHGATAVADPEISPGSWGQPFARVMGPARG